MLEEYLDDSEDYSEGNFSWNLDWSTNMDPETLEAYITKIRASVDTLSDQLLEELGAVQEFLRDGKFDEALAKVSAMIQSLEEVENE